jgi:hypothetical protein
MDHVHQEFLSYVRGPSIAKILKTIKQKHDKSLCDYMKYFCNTRNAIPYIQPMIVVFNIHEV